MMRNLQDLKCGKTITCEVDRFRYAMLYTVVDNYLNIYLEDELLERNYVPIFDYSTIILAIVELKLDCMVKKEFIKIISE